MRAFIFPGQGCQHEGMGLNLYENFSEARSIFEKANDILGRRITDVMFYGTELELLRTENTQPSVFIYEVVLSLIQSNINPDVVAGHSLGEFAALVVNKTLTFEDGLNLVLHRALISQDVCEKYETAMGAVIGLSDDYVSKRLEEISIEYSEPLYVANYNGPGQVVITGSKNGIRIACKIFKNEGAKKAVTLPISGSFHSPYMEEARIQLSYIINKTKFYEPICPIYQCVDAQSNIDPTVIKRNLISHITHPVLWTNMIKNMENDGVSEFYEVGTDDTLQKIVSRMCPDKIVDSIWNLPTYKNLID
jgi:[acyl-carrier-protein] S-malonyltransferase